MSERPQLLLRRARTEAADSHMKWRLLGKEKRGGREENGIVGIEKGSGDCLEKCGGCWWKGMKEI